MVGIRINQKIQLEDGSEVTGFYLDEEGYNRLFNAGNINDRFENVLKRLGEANQTIYQLQKAVEPSLITLCKEAMLAYLQKNFAQKPFQEWPVRVALEKEGFGWTASLKAFESLEKDGQIQRKGKSAWYHLTVKEA